MCGIFGAFSKNERLGLADQGITDTAIANMSASILHRGPDHTGTYLSKNCIIGNVRLSIVDISGGNQPFYSDDKRYVLVQNGEIYNFTELKSELQNEGIVFKTNCDTEVLLRLFEKYHIGMLSRLNGMFAIAIYDSVEDVLYLARDRVGVKPLFYYQDSDKFLFSSEIKSLFHGTVKREVSPDAINSYLFFNYIPPPNTIFKNIYHVPPGSFIRISSESVKQQYWWELPISAASEYDESSAMDQLNSLLLDATKIRLRCDVPYGAFLSGGVDSSSVVGVMSNIIPENVNTFSIGFKDPSYDESAYANYASQLFKTQHKSKVCDETMLSIWSSSVWFSDQPHGDLSFLPTFEVSKLASKYVKVVLTGDGADELFSGYTKYIDIFRELPSDSIDDFQASLTNHISLVSFDDRSQLFTDDFKKKISLGDPELFLSSIISSSGDLDLINKALFVDTKLLLPGNNLVKPDRMTMANSIEARSPFLDYRMVEFAFRLPGKLKLSNGNTKYLLKKTFAPLISDRLAYRKKQMFTVPVGDWFKSSLSRFLKTFLLDEKTLRRNIFKPRVVEKLVSQHCLGQHNHTRILRALVSLELWMRIYIDTIEIPLNATDHSVVKNSL